MRVCLGILPYHRPNCLGLMGSRVAGVSNFQNITQGIIYKVFKAALSKKDSVLYGEYEKDKITSNMHNSPSS